MLRKKRNYWKIPLYLHWIIQDIHSSLLEEENKWYYIQGYKLPPLDYPMGQ